MQNRAVRLLLLALLLLSGLGAGYFTFDIRRRAETLIAWEHEIDARLDRLIDAVGELGVAQQAYVAPGQSDEPWLGRASSLLKLLHDEVPPARARTRSLEAAARWQIVAEGLDTLAATDARARENLYLGQELMASDLLFSEGRNTLEAIASALRELRTAEHDLSVAERQPLLMREAAVWIPVALLWFAGLVVVFRPRRAVPAAPAVAAASTTVWPELRQPAEPRTSSVDLAAAANVCTELSRVANAGALPGLLSKAASVLDASGLIVWLGAGEELFAVTAHGYDPRVLGRLGPIVRTAENATAAAWRSCEVSIVSGDVLSNGAIVAPMFGPDGCIGVLSVEVRQGREADATTRAVTEMLAAQLAALVIAWPAPSGVEGPAPSTVDGRAGSESPKTASA
jgi:hypothetical protein